MCAPLCDAHCEEDVKTQCGQCDPSKPSIKLDSQNGEHQRHFNQGRHNAVKRIRNQRFNAAHTAFNVACHPARLAGQMETQTQGMQMLEGFKRNGARCALRGFGKNQFTQFGEGRGHEAKRAIAQQQSHRHHQNLCGVIGLEAHGIDQVFEQQGHTDIGQFGAHHEQQCRGHSPFVGEQIGQQSFQGSAV